MTKNYLVNKQVFKEHPSKLSPSQIQEHLSTKLHQCALIWSDKCAHCEIAFDELKQKLLSSTQPTEDNLNELKNQIDGSLATLEGFCCLLNCNSNNCITFFQLILEQKCALKENFANSLKFVQDDVVIRCESLKEELEQIKESYHKEVGRTEIEICE